MKQIQKPDLNLRIIFLFALLVLSTWVKAQTKITDYVIFAGFQVTGQTAPPSPGYGVMLGNNVNLLGGAVGSSTMVYASGTSGFGGAIYSNGKINLVGSTTVAGRITAKNALAQSNPVVNIGAGSTIHDLDLLGNGVMGLPGTFSGTLTRLSNATFSGPAPTRLVTNQ